MIILTLEQKLAVEGGEYFIIEPIQLPNGSWFVNEEILANEGYKDKWELLENLPRRALTEEEINYLQNLIDDV